MKFNYIEDVGASAIAESLTMNDVLTNLNIRGCEIGIVGASAIGECLKVPMIDALARCACERARAGEPCADHS